MKQITHTFSNSDFIRCVFPAIAASCSGVSPFSFTSLRCKQKDKLYLRINEPPVCEQLRLGKPVNYLGYLLFVFNKPVFFLVLMKLDYSSFWDRPLLHHHHNYHLEQKKEQTNNHYPIFPPDKKRKQHVKQHSLNNSAGTFNFFGHSQNNCI